MRRADHSGAVCGLLPYSRSRAVGTRHSGRPGRALVLSAAGVHQAVWPTEDWELVRTLVETEIPEDDLFAGIAVESRAMVSA